MTVALRLRMLPRFPARITGTDGVKVVRLPGSPDLTVSLDFATLGDIAGIPDPATNYFAMYDTETGAYYRIPFQSMFDAAGVSAGYPTSAAAELANIPVPVHAIYLFGDATVGDGEGGLFIDINNGNADTFVSADGRTWYRAPDIGMDRLNEAGTAGKNVLAAETAEDAGVAAGQPAYAANTMTVDNAAGTAREAKSFGDVRKALEVEYLPNYSMPLALDPFVLYITTTGTDTTGGDINHGSTQLTAFATFDAAINHAKKYAKFTGRLNAVEFRFGPGAWGLLSIGSNINQGNDWFPFAIYITSIDNANRASFTGITNSSWLPVYVQAKQVKAGYFSVVRRNVMVAWDVSVINAGSVPYCFRFGSMAQMYIFGDVNVEAPVSFSSAFIYGTDRAFCSLENGDTPSIFPPFNLVGAANITSPYKYRIVLGATLYCPSNPYPMLTYATTYWVDAYSLSTQTQQGDDLNKNDAIGGPVVKRSGDTAAGSRISADGYCVQWGNVALSSLTASAVSNNVATITLPVTMLSATYQAYLQWNNVNVLVTRGSTTTTSTFSISANNFSAAVQSATVRWEAHGYIA